MRWCYRWASSDMNAGNGTTSEGGRHGVVAPGGPTDPAPAPLAGNGRGHGDANRDGRRRCGRVDRTHLCRRDRPVDVSDRVPGTWQGTLADPVIRWRANGSLLKAWTVNMPVLGGALLGVPFWKKPPFGLPQSGRSDFLNGDELHRVDRLVIGDHDGAAAKGDVARRSGGAQVMLTVASGSRWLALSVVWHRMKFASHCPAQIRPLLDTVIGG